MISKNSMLEAAGFTYFGLSEFMTKLVFCYFMTTLITQHL